MKVIDLAEKLSSFDDHWSPRIVAELNGQQVKLAKLLGEFDWHFHEDEDEMFLVIKGTLTIHFRDSTVHLKSGQMCVVPRGVEHQPVAEKECEIMLFEPSSTLNTGNLNNERTVQQPENI